jgi:hygromycin-B 7''-O-kinase
MKDTFPNLKILADLDGYRTGFMNPALWSPLIRQICREHRLPCRRILPGTAGTFPTFILDQQYVIKFFGELFNGPQSWLVETAVGRALENQAGLPAARILHSGEVFAGGQVWRWLVFNCIRGRSYHQDYARITFGDKQAVAYQLGKILHGFHRLPVPSTPREIFTAKPDEYHNKLTGWFTTRLHKQPQSGLGLPDHLANQAKDFLAGLRANSSPQTALHLIHADLTQDHILGGFADGRWHINGLIDFGDCMTGDLFYELGLLHLDFFDGDKRLLSEFLSGYGAPDMPDEHFPQRCLAAALQHQFDLFGEIFARHPDLAATDDLHTLARILWDPSSPGLKTG